MFCCSYLEHSPVEFTLKVDARDCEGWVYAVPVVNPPSKSGRSRQWQLCAQLQTFSMLVETTKSRHNFIKTDDRKWVDADRRLSVIIFEKPSIVHHGSLRSIARRKSSGIGIC
jgi:hypothetical protein